LGALQRVDNQSHRPLRSRVSNPFRELGALQLENLSWDAVQLRVSNPFRELGALQHAQITMKAQASIEFQTPFGNWVRCNLKNSSHVNTPSY